MAELKEKVRDKLAKGDFGLPKDRKYPVEDKPHARNAKARASEEYNKGNLSAAKKSEIDKKADRELAKGKRKEEKPESMDAFVARRDREESKKR